MEDENIMRLIVPSSCDLHNLQIPLPQDFIAFKEKKISGKMARALKTNDFYFVISHYLTLAALFNKFFFEMKND